MHMNTPLSRSLVVAVHSCAKNRVSNYKYLTVETVAKTSSLLGFGHATRRLKTLAKWLVNHVIKLFWITVHTAASKQERVFHQCPRTWCDTERSTSPIIRQSYALDFTNLASELSMLGGMSSCCHSLLSQPFFLHLDLPCQEKWSTCHLFWKAAHTFQATSFDVLHGREQKSAKERLTLLIQHWEWELKYVKLLQSSCYGIADSKPTRDQSTPKKIYCALHRIIIKQNHFYRCDWSEN